MLGKLFLSICLLPFLLFANNINKCKLDPSILVTIAKVEKNKKRKAGYPYLISFNNKSDAIFIRKKLGKTIFLDQRTIDCKNKKLCKDITNFLVSQKITNLDLGPFQINYKFHKFKIKKYFNISESYYIACNYIEDNVKKYGKNWYAVAGYHSFSLTHNLEYQKNLKRNYQKILAYKNN